MPIRRALAALFAFSLSAPALAQETLDLGQLTNDDYTVVQKVLYPKKERSELGVHLGVMSFDAFLVTPNLQLSYEKHIKERLAFSVLVGGGYGLQNETSLTLNSPTYNIRPFAYRYLASALVGIEHAPIYAKLNLNGAQVIHFDVYIAARVGATLEQSIIPDGSFAVGPTVSPGLGTRFFLKNNMTLRVELRDDVLLENRKLTQSWHLKQNAGVTVGLTVLSKVKGR